MKKKISNNFGKISNTLKDLLLESYIKKDDKSGKIFSDFIKLLKENKVLRLQHLIYDNLLRTSLDDNVDIKFFIKENFDALKSFTHDELIKSNNKLIKLLENNGVNNLSKSEHDKLFESIHKIITHNIVNGVRTMELLGDYKVIEEHIATNKPVIKENLEPIPSKILVETLIGRFNSKYSDIDDDTKVLLKKLLSTNESECEVFYNSRIQEATNRVNNLLTECDDDIKSDLLLTKEKLGLYQYSKDGFIKDMVKINELLNNIS